MDLRFCSSPFFPVHLPWSERELYRGDRGARSVERLEMNRPLIEYKGESLLEFYAMETAHQKWLIAMFFPREVNVNYASYGPQDWEKVIRPLMRASKK